MDPASFAIMMDTIDQLVDVIFIIAAMGFVLLMVVWIVKIRTGTRLHKQDQAMLLDVNQKLQTMEGRMAALERILDAEVPAWRGNYEDAGDRYGQVG